MNSYKLYRKLIQHKITGKKSRVDRWAFEPVSLRTTKAQNRRYKPPEPRACSKTNDRGTIPTLSDECGNGNSFKGGGVLTIRQNLRVKNLLFPVL